VETILAIGGDGTLNEVVNGFFRQDRPLSPGARLAYLPIGTGSDFQRTLQLPTDPQGVAAAVAGSDTFLIDIGKVTLIGDDGESLARYFANLTSFGMGGDVSIHAKHNWLTGASGKAAFFWATFAVFLRYRGKRVRLRIDEQPQERVFEATNIAIGNGRYHGGGMHPCPLATLDDGLLDVTVIERLNMFELIRDIRVLYSDDVYRHPKVHRFQGRRIEAASDEPVRAEVDGEPLGRLPLQADVLPRVLRLAVPPNWKAN
jgi:YegS/Rv2252/BmrU family lipid kinase